jgi:hypothetical protein
MAYPEGLNLPVTFHLSFSLGSAQEMQLMSAEDRSDFIDLAPPSAFETSMP